MTTVCPTCDREPRSPIVGANATFCDRCGAPLPEEAVATSGGERGG